MCCPASPQNTICFTRKELYDEFKEKGIAGNIGDFDGNVLQKFQDYYNAKNIEESSKEEHRTGNNSELPSIKSNPLKVFLLKIWRKKKRR